MTVNLYRYYPPTLKHDAPGDLKTKVRVLWSFKRDTYAMALQLGVTEAEVANALARIRDGEHA